MSDYFYKTLFLGEEDSDVTIRALGKDWKLHKVFLKQSPYFSCMFSGSWKESSMEKIDLEIVDENITREALAFAFGSLYKEDLHTLLKQEHVVGVLAASTLLLLESLTQHCCNFMVSQTNVSTVCNFYYASQSYCQEEVKNECMKWLTTNIMTASHITFLADISIDLMTSIVSSPYMFVVICEHSIYFMLRRWIYILNHPEYTCTGDRNILVFKTMLWFNEKFKETGKCFLETEDGKQYAPVFAKIRWQDVIQNSKSIDDIKQEMIMPIEWLEPAFRESWQSMLRFASGMDQGPGEVINEEEFDKCSSRYGFPVRTEEKNAWRIVGFNYGFHFSILLNNRVLSLKNRIVPYQAYALNGFVKKHLCCRLTVTNVNQHGQEIVTNTTGIKRISLGVNEEATLMTLDEYVDFPLLLRFNIMLSSKEKPNNSTERNCLLDL